VIALEARVSIHAPVKSATTTSNPSASADFSFNPRAREERDARVHDSLDLMLYVSIHAPVKSATESTILPVRVSVVSIHAPVKSATGVCVLTTWAPEFQSTRP